MDAGEKESELFCGSLSWDATEDDIFNLFSEFGKVINVKLIKDYEGRSRGRAFVKFETAEDAEQGLQVNGQEHMGRQLKVNYSSDKPTGNTRQNQGNRGGHGGRGGHRNNAPADRAPKFDQENELFVGSLSWNATEDDIFTAFSEYGKVLNVKLLKDYDGRSRGRAYVKFADAAGAEAGCSMNGQEHMGR